MLWWATPEILIFLQTFRLERKPVGIIQGNPGGWNSVKTSLADVWFLVKKCLVIDFWYFSEEVKLENDFFSWSEREDLNLD